MAELFDKYDKSFGAVVQSSIDFSGLPHSFFTAAKADALRELIATRLHGMHNPHISMLAAASAHFIHSYGVCSVGYAAPMSPRPASLKPGIRNPEVQYEAYDGRDPSLR